MPAFPARGFCPSTSALSLSCPFESRSPAVDRFVSPNINIPILNCYRVRALCAQVEGQDDGGHHYDDDDGRGDFDLPRRGLPRSTQATSSSDAGSSIDAGHLDAGRQRAS